MKDLHPVFHASLLRAFQDNGSSPDRPPPIEVEGSQEFEVSAIKGHRRLRGNWQFLTAFKGYDPSEDMWLTPDQLENANELLSAYVQQRGLKL